MDEYHGIKLNHIPVLAVSSLGVVANSLTVAAVACSPGKLTMHKKLISLAVLDCCIAVDFLIYSIVEIFSSLDI